MNRKIKVLIFILFLSLNIYPQFLDDFDKERIEGWFFLTGDGKAEMDFVQMDGYARMIIDATKDKHNVWWAITKRDVTPFLDLKKLEDPSYELRVEAKVKVSHAPRRLNFMINTQRTTNYHEHLMEYDIPDTSNWHVISMTTKNLDAVPGDTLFVQLDATDLGSGKYYVDVDYYKADIVNVNQAGPDKGEPLPYHPPVPDVNTFSNHLNVYHDALINSDFPDVNFNNWYSSTEKENEQVLTINGNQWAVLRWNFNDYPQDPSDKNVKADGAGLLELTTYSVFEGGNYSEVFGEDLGMEFGKVRVIEILTGDPEWDQNSVTYNSLIQGKEYSEVFNTQMIFDFEVSSEKGSKNFITISRPVLQRLLDGKTKGLLLRPLGAINPSFYSSENNVNSAKLHFNIKE